MKHSCGHAAPRDMPKQAVRSVPRCNACAERYEAAQIAGKPVHQLTASDLKLRAAHALAKPLTRAERDAEVHHAMTGD